MRHHTGTAAPAPQGATGGGMNDRQWPELAGLNVRQRRGLHALLTATSTTRAAEQSKIGERTLRRWLAQPTFRTAYRTCSRLLFEDAIGQLRAAAGEAVRVLREALAEDNASVRVRAALGILDAAAVADLDDVLRRLERLENNETDTDPNFGGAAGGIGAASGTGGADTDNDLH